MVIKYYKYTNAYGDSMVMLTTKTPAGWVTTEGKVAYVRRLEAEHKKEVAKTIKEHTVAKSMNKAEALA